MNDKKIKYLPFSPQKSALKEKLYRNIPEKQLISCWINIIEKYRPGQKNCHQLLTLEFCELIINYLGVPDGYAPTFSDGTTPRERLNYYKDKSYDKSTTL